MFHEMSSVSVYVLKAHAISGAGESKPHNLRVLRRDTTAVAGGAYMVPSAPIKEAALLTRWKLYTIPAMLRLTSNAYAE